MPSGLLNFVVSLEDRVSPQAKAAADAMKKLETELRTSKSALATYQQQLSRANELGDVEGHKKYATLVAHARQETFRLQDALGAVGPQASAASGALGDLVTTLTPFVGIAEVGIGVVTGLAVALAALAIEGVRTAISVGEVNKRLTATFEALGDKPGQGKKTLDFLNDLSTKLPQSRDQLAKWAQQYESFGITDLGELRGQIHATAAAQAIAGDEGANAYQKLAEKIQDAIQGHHKLKMGRDVLKDIALAGSNASDVAARLGLSLKDMDTQLKAGTLDAGRFGAALEISLQKRGEGPLAAMSSQLGTLKEKFKETWDHLFDGIDTSPITDAIKGIIELGNQAEPSGQQLHAGITGALQGIIDWMGKMLVEGEVLFLTLELYAVQHRKGLALVAKGFTEVGATIMTVARALEFLAAGPGADAMAVMQAIADALGFVGSGYAGPPRKGKTNAPAHAAGGLVGEPAAGEKFASVAPGEMILPKDSVRQLAGSGLGPVSSSFSTTNVANTNGSQGGVRIDTLHLHIDAPEGVTDATQVSATGLAIALQRYQLASGR